MTLPDKLGGELERLTAEKGFRVEAKGGDLLLSFTARTADEALERLRTLSGLLASKG